MNFDDSFKKPSKISKKLKKLRVEKDPPKPKEGELFDKVNELTQENDNNNENFNAASHKKLAGKQDAETTIQKSHETEPDQAKRQLKMPYDFLKKKNASFHTIVFPHFSWKSITFILSLLHVVLFVILFLISYSSKKQDGLTWSCTLFKLQNKFFPRLRYNYQFWRILVSALFHSNISHAVLNIIGIQVYGYFVEWYYGKVRYTVAVVIAIVAAHLFSCLTNQISVSTTSSAILFAFLALKICFFIAYRDYQPLQDRNIPLYGLLALVFGMNLIPLFIGTNVDYGAYIAGFLMGALCGIIYFPFQRNTIPIKILRWVCIMAIIGSIVGMAVGCFTLNQSFFKDLNTAIDGLC